MQTINGIPSSAGLQSALGRTGLSVRFKKRDPELENIFRALTSAEGSRSAITEGALGPLRQLRKACIEWLKTNDGKRRWERTRIHNLWKAVHARVTEVIETVFDKTRSPTVRQYKETKSFNRLTDSILRGNAGVAVKTVDKSYDIERFTTRHLPGATVDLMIKPKWEAAKTRLSLPDWIEHVLIPQSEEDPAGRFYFGQTTQTARQLKAGVKYCSPKERMDFLIESWGDGELFNADFERFHTGPMKSASGDGWAIFVVDLQERIYAGPYAYGEFHHSSFLAGAPVLAAGEIAVDQGRVVGLTNKTGHYKAGPAELKRMLELLRAEKVPLHDVAVNDPIRARDKWFRGTEALQAGGDLAKLGEGTIDQPPPVPA